MAAWLSSLFAPRPKPNENTLDAELAKLITTNSEQEKIRARLGEARVAELKKAAEFERKGQRSQAMAHFLRSKTIGKEEERSARMCTMLQSQMIAMTNAKSNRDVIAVMHTSTVALQDYLKGADPEKATAIIEQAALNVQMVEEVDSAMARPLSNEDAVGTSMIDAEAEFEKFMQQEDEKEQYETEQDQHGSAAAAILAAAVPPPSDEPRLVPYTQGTAQVADLRFPDGPLVSRGAPRSRGAARGRGTSRPRIAQRDGV